MIKLPYLLTDSAIINIISLVKNGRGVSVWCRVFSIRFSEHKNLLGVSIEISDSLALHPESLTH